MKRIKQILALAAVVLLLGMYGATMVFAFMDSPGSDALFKASVTCTIMVPVLLYAYQLVYRYFGNKQKERMEERIDKMNENREINTIIFDVGRVLVDFDWESYLESFGYDKEKEKAIAEAIFLSDVWNERDRGALSEEDYLNMFVANAPQYEEEIRKVMADEQKCIQVFDYADTWTGYLKSQGYRLYILSNFSQHALEKVRKNFTFLRHMDGIIFSCEVKEIKPEPAIYQVLLDTYGIDPQKAVFIDDRRDNIEAAEKFGIHTVQFKDFRQAAGELEKLQVR